MSRLDAHLGYWLRQASNQVSRAFSSKVEEKGVTVAEWGVLRELYEGDRRPSAVAASLGLTRGAISKLADRLVAKQLITQRASGGDGRGQMLALTGIGRVIVPTLAALAEETEQEFFGDLDPRTREAVLKALRAIAGTRGQAP